MNPSLFRVDNKEGGLLVIGAVTSIWHCSAQGVKESTSVCVADKWALTDHTRSDRRISGRNFWGYKWVVDIKMDD